MSRSMDRIRETLGSEVGGPDRVAMPRWIWTVGLASWLLLGVAGAIIAIAAFIAASASISIPLILAAVIGAIASPLAERLQRRGLSSPVAAGAVLVGLVAILVATIWVTVAGIISQGPEIWTQLEQGVDSLVKYLADAGVDVEALKTTLTPQQAEAAASSGLLSGVLASVTSWLSTGLSSIFALFFGVFISAALLFYVLSDFEGITSWIGAHLGLPPELGAGLVRDAVDTMRGYFRGTTITGLAVAGVIGLAVWILGVPLAFTIALVTFLTCYIPYFGAIVSGAFAFLVALGSGGAAEAIIVLIIVLVAQNLLQTVVNAKVMGGELNLHPLVVLVVTMMGGIFAGLLGAALGAPLTALAVRATARFREVSGQAAHEIQAAAAEL